MSGVPDLPEEWLCVDVGFTRTRTGVWSGSAFDDVTRIRTINTFAEGLTTGPARRELWLAWLSARVRKILKVRPNIARIGLCLPGPVEATGRIAAPNSIWGETESALEPEELEAALERPVTVINDVAATATRYGQSLGMEGARRVIVVNVGSGIGAKLYDGATGQVVLGPTGRDGEIGFSVVDESPHALATDDGELRGRLGLYASGIGFAKLLRASAETEPAGFNASLLSQRLVAAGYDVRSLSPGLLNKAAISVLEAGDPFVMKVLRRSADSLARVLHTIILFSAPDRVVIAGGFAAALGELYGNELRQSLKPLLEPMYSGEETGSMVVMGKNDGLDNLLGLTMWMTRRP